MHSADTNYASCSSAMIDAAVLQGLGFGFPAIPSSASDPYSLGLAQQQTSMWLLADAL